jgi:hypothetical protein
VYDAGSMGGLDSIADLNDDARNLVARERSVTLRIPFEDLSGCPFNGKEVQSWAGFPSFDRPNDVWMLNAGTKLRFSKKSGNRSPVLAKLLAQDLECYDSVLRMVCTVDRGGSTLPDHILDAVPG